MDEIIIGIGVNDNKKPGSLQKNVLEMIKTLRKGISHTVEAYDNLKRIDFCNRGTQSSLSEESVLFVILNIETIADISRKLAGIETILLFTEPGSSRQFHCWH